MTRFCAEAPSDFKRYHPSETKHVRWGTQGHGLSSILFLKVRFGLTHFKEREQFLTDDPQDGGIDGYFLDEEHKTIYLIQSKFRSSEINFKEKEILFSELLQMDVDRVVDGEETDEKGVPYNSKIRKMQKAISQIPDIARWKYEVAILANVPGQVSPSHLKRLTGGHPAIL